MLDTTALSAWADGDAGLLRVLPNDRLWHLPVVALGEFLFGIRRSRERAKLERWIEEVKATCALVGVDATADHYAGIREELRRGGSPIPENDELIRSIPLLVRSIPGSLHREVQTHTLPGAAGIDAAIAQSRRGPALPV
jgi:tRNA(fMet)-specific endonuclease VapC